jgi:hypothetical protein
MLTATAGATPTATLIFTGFTGTLHADTGLGYVQNSKHVPLNYIHF